jgi:hypothetical protein
MAGKSQSFSSSLPLIKIATNKTTKIGSTLPSLCAYDDDDENDDEDEKDETQTEKNKMADNKNKNDTKNIKTNKSEQVNKQEDDDDDEEEKEVLKLNPKLAASLRSRQEESSATATTSMPKKPSGLLGLLPPPKSNLFANKTALDKSKDNTESFARLLPRTLNSNKASASNKSTTAAEAVSSASECNASSSHKHHSYFHHHHHHNHNNEHGCNDQHELTASKRLKNKDFEQMAHAGAFQEIQDPEPVFSDDDNDQNEAEEEEARLRRQEELRREILSEEVMTKLGGVGKRKRNLDEIEIKEIDAKEIVGDQSANLMRQLTGDYNPPRNKEYFTSSSRRTHHITYLAYVAKDREQELRNTWAQNKQARQQSKMKYGF